VKTVRGTTAGVLAIVFVLTLCNSHAQTTPAAQQQETLAQFFERTIKSSQSTPTDEKTLDRVERRAAGASAEEISDALPLIIAAVQSDDEMAVRCAGISLIAISVRQDSGALLRPYVSELARLFDSPKDYLRRSSLLMLATLKPVPPPEAVVVLLSFVKRTDADTQFQAATISGLLANKPYNEAVLQTAEQFMSRPLESTTRVVVLNGVRHSLVKDVRIERIVLRDLSDPNPGVQRAAIGALDRMGPEALTSAQPALAILAKSEDKDLAAAARAALARIAPPPQ
jgi:hypothetical protein